MREIKFRAWDGSKMFLSGNCDLYDLGGWFKAHSRIMAFDEKENDSIIMQFTGLKDKNGVEIYEGDILKIHAGHHYWLDKKFEVVFYEGAFCMKPKVIGLLDKPVSFIYYGDMALKNGYEEDFGIYIEVIGNIYQNPELLKD